MPSAMLAFGSSLLFILERCSRRGRSVVESFVDGPASAVTRQSQLASLQYASNKTPSDSQHVRRFQLRSYVYPPLLDTYIDKTIPQVSYDSSQNQEPLPSSVNPPTHPKMSASPHTTPSQSRSQSSLASRSSAPVKRQGRRSRWRSC